MTWQALSLAGLLTIGCAVSPEVRLRDQMVTEIYVDAARTCETSFRSLRMDRVDTEGNLTLDVEANQTQDLPGFAECYWKGIAQRVEHRRQAGLPVPDSLNLKPSVDQSRPHGR
jgi:hypothetical protein